jgi:hypothetical protein
MDLWTGLACVKLNPEIKDADPFDGGKGAWSNVVAWVDSQDEFEKRVRRHAEGMGYILIELKEVQLLETRMSREDYPEELIEMQQTATRQPEDSIWGTLHIWERDDTN